MSSTSSPQPRRSARGRTLNISTGDSKSEDDDRGGNDGQLETVSASKQLKRTNPTAQNKPRKKPKTQQELADAKKEAIKMATLVKRLSMAPDTALRDPSARHDSYECKLPSIIRTALMEATMGTLRKSTYPPLENPLPDLGKRGVDLNTDVLFPSKTRHPTPKSMQPDSPNPKALTDSKTVHHLRSLIQLSVKEKAEVEELKTLGVEESKSFEKESRMVQVFLKISKDAMKSVHIDKKYDEEKVAAVRTGSLRNDTNPADNCR